MSKVKLDRVLFEFMEKMTKEGKYNYEQFIHELSKFVDILLFHQLSYESSAL